MIFEAVKSISFYPKPATIATEAAHEKRVMLSPMSFVAANHKHHS
jgi:hypothetical protein